MEEKKEPIQVPIDAAKAEMNEYVAVFPEPEPPPGEYQFTAINDDHAKGLMEKKYPSQGWKLYRLAEGRREKVCSHPEEPPGSDSHVL